MKYATGLLALASLALAKEIPRDPKRHAELYESGLMHERLMNIKHTAWAEQEAVIAAEAAATQAGLSGARLASALAVDPFPEEHFAQCRDGKSVPIRDQPLKFYRCKNVSIYSSVTCKVMLTRVGQSAPFPVSFRSRHTNPQLGFFGLGMGSA